MKALPVASSAQNIYHDRVRLSITLAGIVTAIIGLMALVYETRSTESRLVIPRLIEIPKVSSGDLWGKIESVAPATWPL